MASEGDFELLRAYVTTVIQQRRWAETLRKIRFLKGELKSLEKPVRIKFAVDAGAGSIAGQIQTAKKSLSQLQAAKPAQVKVTPVVPKTTAIAAIRQAIAHMEHAGLLIRLKIDVPKLIKDAEQVAVILRNRLNAGLGAIGAGAKSVVSKLPKGPKIDPVTGSRLDKMVELNKKAYLGIASVAEGSAKRVKAAWSGVATDPVTGQIVKKVDRLASAYLGVGRVAEKAATETKAAFRNVATDLVTGVDKATNRFLEYFNKIKAAGKTQAFDPVDYQRRLRVARQTIASIREGMRIRKQEAAQIKRNAAEEARLRATNLQQVRSSYSRYAEIASRSLFEVRRQLHGLGAVSALVSRQLTKDQQTFANLTANLRQAKDLAGVNKAGAALQAFSARVAGTATVLSRFHAAVAVVGVGLGVIKTAAKLVLAPLFALSRVLISIGNRVIGVAWGAFRAGIKSLLAPTLLVINAFRRLASYLPLIFSYGLISWIKSAVNEFSTFQENVGRAAAQMQLFGAEGRHAMDELGVRARQISLEWLTGQQELAKAAEELARGGVAAGLDTTREKIAAVARELEGVAAISLATGFDPATIARGIAVIRAQYGRIGDEADDLADSILYLQSQAPITIKDINKFMESAGAAGRLARLEWDELAASGVKIMQNVPSGSRAGTALARGMLKILDPTKEALQVMRELGTEVTKFTDQSRQAFAKGGWREFVRQSTDALIGPVDVLREVGFRAREFANIFNVDPKGAKKTRQTIDDLVEGIRKAQKEDFAEQFASFLRDNTLFGALKRLKNELLELKLSFTETFMPIITRVITGFNNLVSAISKWIRTSGAARTIQAKLLQLWDKLNTTLAPIIGKYLRLLAIINAGLIAAVGSLVNTIAGKLLPLVSRLSKRLESALSLPPGTLESWEGTAQVIAFTFNNIENIISIAKERIKAKLAEIGIAIIESFQAGVVSQALARTFERIGDVLGHLANAVPPVAAFIARTLIAAFDLAMDHISPAFSRAMLALIDKHPVASGLFGLTAWKGAFLLDAQVDTESVDQFLARMKEASLKLSESLSQNLGTPGREALENYFNNAKSKLEDVRDTAQSTADSLQGMFQFNIDDQLDKLDQQAKEMAAINERMQAQARQRNIEATLTSKIIGIEDFAKLLQEGNISKQQLDEQRGTNSRLDRVNANLGRLIEHVTGDNPDAIGGGALGLFGG